MSAARLLLSTFGPALKTGTVGFAPLDANGLIGRQRLAKIAKLVQGGVEPAFGLVRLNTLLLGSGVGGPRGHAPPECQEEDY